MIVFYIKINSTLVPTKRTTEKAPTVMKKYLKYEVWNRLQFQFRPIDSVFKRLSSFR